MIRTIPGYTGRFAPSPTGPLHFGSLVAALASFLDARAASGRWLVRIEDVDTTRAVPGAADDILACLRAFGLEWDGEVITQSARGAVYAAAFERLEKGGWVFPCACSRRELEGDLYPGTCQAGIDPARPIRSWRARVDAEPVEFTDRWMGRRREILTESSGGFILRRADGVWAYQLAVVVDDAAQDVTHVVRGEDLFESTARQIWLQQRLGYPRVAYLHIPVARDAEGRKLSKQNRALPLDPADPAPALRAALRFLELEAEDLAAGVTAWARHRRFPPIPDPADAPPRPDSSTAGQ
jgi:glutamyl-Q tRNA(Asp) synthetase